MRKVLFCLHTKPAQKSPLILISIAGKINGLATSTFLNFWVTVKAFKKKHRFTVNLKELILLY